jgi:hypothetical protein
MARDRKSALAASIQAEREASQGRVPRFDKFERAESALRKPKDSPRTRTGERVTSGTTRTAHARTIIVLEKVIRDSFTMPSRDYKKITQLREKCLKAGLSATKSEVLRAGLHALEGMSVEDFRRVVQSVEKVKTGRPGRG